MNDKQLYQEYLSALLAGRRQECRDVVQRLLDGGIGVKTLYTDLFQHSLYEVGELWENNRITVANEHLATSITESLLNLVYPEIFSTERTGKKAVVSCSANEFHQIGGKMVADLFEINGWDSHFLGANTPPNDMAKFVEETRPDVVGLSLSILSNIAHLERCIEAVRSRLPDVEMLIGGQAFRWGRGDEISRLAGVKYIASLDDLERVMSES